MSLFRTRFVANDFAPVFHLLNEASRAPACGPAFQHSVRSFQPRFDVRETKDSYELQGEVPGIDQKDISIEFNDKTLSISGRTERHHEEGTRSTAQVEAQAEQPKAVESESSEASSSYHKPTAVDEDDFVNVADETKTEATPTETPQASVAETQETAQPAKTDRSRYWIHERSVGQFARTFSFQKRVDQEHIKASLNNGILSIVVPKVPTPEKTSINVE